jgi:hypothetical protein
MIASPLALQRPARRQPARVRGMPSGLPSVPLHSAKMSPDLEYVIAE